MAALNVNPLLQVAPPARANGNAANPSQSMQADSAPERSSFSQAMKSASDAAKAPDRKANAAESNAQQKAEAQSPAPTQSAAENKVAPASNEAGDAKDQVAKSSVAEDSITKASNPAERILDELAQALGSNTSKDSTEDKKASEEKPTGPTASVPIDPATIAATSPVPPASIVPTANSVPAIAIDQTTSIASAANSANSAASVSANPAVAAASTADSTPVPTPASATASPTIAKGPHIAAGETSTHTSSDVMLTESDASTQSAPGDLAQAGQKNDAAANSSLLTNKSSTEAVATSATTEAQSAAPATPENANAVSTTPFGAELDQARQALAANHRNTGVLGANRPVEHTIASPVSARGWSEEVGQRLSWVAQHDNGRAELVLNPAHLGRVEVTINLNGDQASAAFVAANPTAREALQDALPRLREVLNQAGIQLGQASVSSGNGGQAQADQRGAQPAFAFNSRLDIGMDPASGTSRGLVGQGGNGLIDTFA